VRGIDQRLQFFGPAVRRIGRERQHAVVAPVARAGERVDGHQLDRRHAERGQRRQPPLDVRVAAARADVQLVQHRFVPRPAAPCVVAPAVRGRIDDLARAVHVVRLEARRRVRHREAVVEHVAVQRTGAARGDHLEPAVAGGCMSMRCSPGRLPSKSPCSSSAALRLAGAHSRKRVSGVDAGRAERRRIRACAGRKVGT
jgi:hypothetical protein